MNLRKLLLPVALSIVTLFSGISSTKAQTTITTTFANNNGSGMVTFNFVNNSTNAVNITEIGSVCGASTTQTVTAWYKAGAISGPPGTIDPGNGWTQFGSGTITGITNSSTTTAQVFFPTATSTLNQITVPAGATYGMAVSSTNLRYSTLTAGTYTTSGGSCDIVTGTNIGYGGSVPPTAPTITPRGFIGYVTYVPAVACSGTPLAGTAVTSTVNPCAGSSINISLSGGSLATGITYQLESSTNNITFTPAGTSSTTPQFNITPTGATYYRIVSTCTNSALSNTSASVYVSTPGVISMFPFIEGFNSGSLPNCWTNTNSISSTSATMFWKFTGAPGYGTTSNGRPAGSFAWLDASTPYNGVVTMTSPAIDLSSLASPYVQFDWFKNNSSSSTSTVPPNYPSNNLMLEGYDGNNWVTLFDDTSNAAMWRTERITLPASFSGVTNAQFRFSVDKFLSNYQYDDVLLDSLMVMNTPSCLPPVMPTVTSAQATTATFSWTAPTPVPATGYVYEVRTSGNAGSGATGLAASGNTAAGSTTANVTGLAPATTHTIYVRSVCGAGDSSLWAPGGTFTTACATLTAPYNEGFNSGSLPNCWTNDNTISSTTANLLWKFTGAPGYGTASNGRPNGTFAWVDASSPYNAVVTLTSPFIDLSGLAAPFVKFDWFKDNGDTPPFTNNNLMLEGYDGNAWVQLFNDTSNAPQWRTERITLPASFNGVTNAQFRFSVDKSLSNDFYDDLLLDSFSVTNTPSCLPPVSPVVTSALATTATFSWTAPTPAPASGYLYEVRTSGAAGSGATGLAASGNTAVGVTTANVTGLIPVTYYTVYVRSFCGVGDSSIWSSTGIFSTACATVTAPYAEGFNLGSLPNCWTNTNSISSTSTYAFWKFTGAPGYGTTNNGRPNGTFAWVDANSPYNTVVTLTSPVIDLSSLATPFVKFDWFKDNGSTAATFTNNNLMLEGYDGNNWVTLFNDTSNAAMWRTVRITLPASFSGVTAAQFRFSVDKSLSNSLYDDVLLDSFSVIDAPSCLPPTMQTVTGVTSTSATLTWTASVSAPANGYAYEVRSSGAAGSGPTGLAASGNTAAGSNSANLSGLAPATTYSIFVRAVCGAGDSSVWAAGPTFTTACATFTAPYMEGFNSGALPNCWTNDNSISSISTTMFWKFTGTPGYGTTSNGRPIGSYTWLDASSPYNGVVTLTSPFIDLSSLAVPYVKFDWFKDNGDTRATFTNNNLMLEGYDGNNWVTLFDDTSNANMWRTERITLPASFSGVTAAQFRFSVDKFQSNYQYDDVLLDSFSVTNAPSCLPPDMPTITAVTPTSATLSWTAPTSAPAGGYMYEVRSSGAAGSGTTGLAASGTTATGSTTASAGSLTPATTYSFYVRAICGAGDSSVWVPGGSFTTACATLVAPYTQGFNSGSLPPCWTNTNSIGGTSANLLWKFTGIPGYGTASNGRPTGSYAWLDASTPYNAVVTLTSPFIDLSGLAAPFVKFDWFKDNGDTPPFTNNNLMLEGYDGTAWVQLFNDTSNAPQWRTENIILPAAFAGVTNAQFRFSVDKSLSNDFYDDLLLDSFFVGTQVVACAAPTGVTVSNITSNSATITWTAATPAPANGYEYEVRSGGVVATGTTAAGATTVNLTGLTAGSNDTVYVRSVCAVGTNSGWTTAVVFQTPASCIPPVVALGNDTTFCSGNAVTLNAGNAGSTYVWSNGATTQSTTVSTSGSYSVAVTNGGCIGRDTINVTVNPTPVVSLGNDTAICAGNSVTLTAGNTGSTYLWSNGATTQTTTVSTSGSYSVAVTNGGCSGRDTINVTVNPAPAVMLGNDTTICAATSLTLSAGTSGSTYMWSTGATTQSISVTTAGSYSVAVTNAGGCVGRDTIMVSINPLPVAGTITTTGQSPTFTFTVNGSANAAIRGWRFGDGVADTGLTATHTYTANGTYTVTFYAANGCGADSVSTTVTVTNVGVDNVVADGAVRLFPNPATSLVTIENTAAQSMKSIRIMDIAGALVREVKATNGKEQVLDISNLSSGTYLVRIELEGGAIALRKLQIKH